jgi:N-acetylglucosaminyl-diphospho-decaprenol L-rhamnosyltransferase
MTNEQSTPSVRPVKVSGVVVHRRSLETVVSTLDDLLHQTVRLEQIIVVDNSEDSRLRAELGLEYDNRVQILEVPNRGYGAGMNMGVQAVDEDIEFVLLCTHEVGLEHSVTAGLVAAAGPNDGLLAPLLGRRSRGTVWSAGGFLDGASFRPKNIGRGERVHAWRDREPFDIEWTDGAVMLVRRSAFLSIGGFVEEYFLYHEDVELCLNLAAHGWNLRAVPSALAWQEPAGAMPRRLV